MSEATVALAAFEPEFELKAGPHELGDLQVLRFDAQEELSRPFSVEVTVVPQRGVEVDAKALLSQPALLRIKLDESTARFVNGVVGEVRTWEEGRGEHRRRLLLRIVPKLWLLGHVRRSRVFQELSTVQIVKQVLGEAEVKLSADKLRATYPERVYCVQYDESDLDFVSRLLEEDGISYWFDHQETQHTVVLGDAPDAFTPIDGEAGIVFREPTKMVHEKEHFDAFSARLEVCPGKVSLRDYDELRPALDLTAASTAKKDAALEVYEYPGGYTDDARGKALAKVRLDEERLRAETARGSCFSRRLQPGHVFELLEHPLDALNGKYTVLSVAHHGEQPEVLFGAAPMQGKKPEAYRAEIACVRAELPVRPGRRTRRPVIPGPQTAVVVGAAGEEIHCDTHGRIKVQFHWDREGKKNEHSSCWIRVGQSWAGPGWGALYLPRIGQEVVVEFLEGDPDRPLVTGAVYNGTHPPPITLPDEKTKSTLKSASSPGGGGFNELRFEDLKGKEQVFLHAQKDFETVVEHDDDTHVKRHQTLKVDGDRARTIGANQTLKVGKDDTSHIHGNQALQVDKDRSVTVGGSHEEKISGSQSITIGSTFSLSVGATSSEKIGGSKSIKVVGAYALSVAGAMTQTVGGAMTDEVGGAKVETVAGKKSETVSGARSLKVEKDFSEEVGGKRSLKVGKDLSVEVGKKLSHTVKEAWSLKAKELSFTADDRFVVKVGSATLELKKDGTVVIKGAKIQVQSDGDIVLKAPKVTQN